MLRRRGVLRGTLVVRVSFHRLGRGRRLVLTVARTGNLARPQQLWDQQNRGENAACATSEHDQV